MNWTTRDPGGRNELAKLPRPKQVRIRRKAGARGFYHKGKVVQEGEEVVCDEDIAHSLIFLGKAEPA